MKWIQWLLIMMYVSLSMLTHDVHYQSTFVYKVDLISVHHLKDRVIVFIVYHLNFYGFTVKVVLTFLLELLINFPLWKLFLYHYWSTMWVWILYYRLSVILINLTYVIVVSCTSHIHCWSAINFIVMKLNVIWWCSRFYIPLVIHVFVKLIVVLLNVLIMSPDVFNPWWGEHACCMSPNVHMMQMQVVLLVLLKFLPVS